MSDPRFAKLLDLQHELDERKKLYAEFDKLLMELVRDGELKAEIDGMVLEIKDNFADVNTGWTRSAVRRFDLEVITKELAAKRAAKKEKTS